MMFKILIYSYFLILIYFGFSLARSQLLNNRTYTGVMVRIEQKARPSKFTATFSSIHNLLKGPVRLNRVGRVLQRTQLLNLDPASDSQSMSQLQKSVSSAVHCSHHGMCEEYLHNQQLVITAFAVCTHLCLKHKLYNIIQLSEKPPSVGLAVEQNTIMS